MVTINSGLLLRFNPGKVQPAFPWAALSHFIHRSVWIPDNNLIWGRCVLPFDDCAEMTVFFLPHVTLVCDFHSSRTGVTFPRFGFQPYPNAASFFHAGIPAAYFLLQSLFINSGCASKI